MSKLTEDETVQLLRETFAEQERLADARPAVTTPVPRRRTPSLVAAASILVVLAGAFIVTDQFGTDGSGPDGQAATQAPGPSTGPATGPASDPAIGQSTTGQQPADDAAVWAAVALAGTDLDPQARPWPVIFVRETPNPRTGETTRGAPFPPAVRQAIQTALARLGRVQWVAEPRVAHLPSVCGKPNAAKCPSLTLGPIVRTGDLAEVSFELRRGCATFVGADYQLRRQDSGWTKPSMSTQLIATPVC